MEKKKRLSKALAVAAACILLLGVFLGAPYFLTQPQGAAFLAFFQTGRALFPLPEALAAKFEERAQLSAEDGNLVEIDNRPGVELQLGQWLETPLTWDLTQGGPKVLILHTHATESYKKTENYRESSLYRTRDNGYNTVSIGNRVAELLRAGGIEVVQDTRQYDYPRYNGAYDRARKSIQEYLEKYPDICLVLDLHRDAVTDESGKYIPVSATKGEVTAAQMMLVMATGTKEEPQPHWQENVAFAFKLQMVMQNIWPGICRPLALREARYNQDLCPGAVLVEVGSVGNTRAQALQSAEVLAEAILTLAKGATVD